MALTCCLKALLVLINLIVFLLGILFAAVGGIMNWGYPLIQSLLQSTLNTVADLLRSFNVNVDPVQIVQLVLNLAKYLSLPLFILGVVLVVLSLCGMCGACCTCRPLLVLYIGITGILVLFQIGIIIAYFAAGNVFDKWAKDQLLNSITPFQGIANSTNLETIVWSFAQSLLGCCGVENGTDFDKMAPNWTRSYCPNSASCTTSLKYPLTCCKMKPFPSLDPLYSICPLNNVHNSTTSNYDIGCYKKLRDSTNTYVGISLGVLGGIVLLQVILITFAIVICRSKPRVSPI